MNCSRAFIYASNSSQERDILWQTFDQLALNFNSNQNAWILLGDFNAIRSFGEKLMEDGSSFHVNPNLNECLNRNGLMDLNFSGAFYTWNNKQTDGKKILCKLDRILANQAWIDEFPNFRARFEPPECSDHSPAILHISDNCFQRKNRSFRFKNTWCDHPKFDSTVSSTWRNKVVNGVKMFSVVSKLKALKLPLRKLGGGSIDSEEIRIKRLIEKLKSVQTELFTRPCDVDVLRQEQATLSELKEAIASRNTSLQQSAKLHWIKFQDSCSSYFYNSVKMRRARSNVNSLYNDEGILVTEDSEIKRCVVDHFQDLLGTRRSCQPCDTSIFEEGPVVSEEAKRAMIEPFSREEVKQAVWDIGINKTPGPDGFNAKFFRKAWPTIGDEVTDAVLDFFRSGRYLKEVGSTTIALIPKKENVSHITDYRPISCCTTMSKIISKLIVKRLQDVLPIIIDKNQGAFIKGRSIKHNIAVCQDIVKSYGRKYISPRCAIKIDLKKAYDTLDWLFIKQILEGFGFHQVMINWILESISSASFSVNFNGELHGYIKGERGIRQGDPLSPYIFVLAMEYFTRLLKRMSKSRGFKHHPNCKRAGVVNICFADDLFLFTHGSEGSLDRLNQELDRFCSMSGLNINASKSLFFYAGIEEQKAIDLASRMNLKIGKLPVTYLGVPLCSAGPSKADYKPLIAKISAKINAWAARHLSYAGRYELLRAVLYGILNYWCKIFILPKGVVNLIITLLRNFLWSGSGEGRKAPIAWSRVCKPRDEGGLGFKEILSWNKACFAELIFDMLVDSGSIWHDWANKVILRGVSFWDIECKSTSSAVWNAIIHLREEIKTTMEHGVHPAAIMSRGGRFDWKLVFDSLRERGSAAHWNKCIWGKLNTPRISFSVWMIASHGVHTKDKLKAFNILQEDECVLCEEHGQESHDHLWFKCKFSKEVLQRVLAWANLGRNYDTFGEWLEAMERMKCRKSFKFNLWIACFCAVSYFIWRVRNCCIFQDMQCTVDDCVSLAINHVRNCIKARWSKRNREALRWCTRLGI